MTKKNCYRYRKAFKIINDAIETNIIIEDIFIASHMAKADSMQHNLNNAYTNDEKTCATRERDIAIYNAEKHLLTLRRLETLRGMLDAFRADFHRFIK